MLVAVFAAGPVWIDITDAAYGYTSEWWGSYMELRHLRARWYAPEIGTFLSVDPVESEPPYQYVRGNPVNRIDPSGLIPLPRNSCQACSPKSQVNNGYSESAVTSVTFGHPRWVLQGTEVVFDFATLEIGEFEPTLESTSSGFQIDIGLLSLGTVYQASYISGFESEPDGNLRWEYGPSVVNLSWGVSWGFVITAKGGYQSWSAEDFSLSGTGYWYGSEISALDAASYVYPSIAVYSGGVPINFSYYKSSTRYRNGVDLGDVCTPEDARKFLTVLETWPYPLNYVGLYPGRLGAISKFKAYADLD